MQSDNQISKYDYHFHFCIPCVIQRYMTKFPNFTWLYFPHFPNFEILPNLWCSLWHCANELCYFKRLSKRWKSVNILIINRHVSSLNCVQLPLIKACFSSLAVICPDLSVSTVINQFQRVGSAPGGGAGIPCGLVWAGAEGYLGWGAYPCMAWCIGGRCWYPWGAW